MKVSLPFFLFIVLNGTLLAQGKTEIFVTVDGKKFTRHQRDSIEKLGNFIGVKEKHESKDTLFTSIFYYDKQLLLTPLQKRFVDKVFPAVDLPSMQYDTVRMNKLKGKIVMLMVWSASTSEDELIQLNDLEEHYKDQVAFIAITSQNEEEMRAVLKIFRFSFTVVPDAKALMQKYGMEEGSYFFIDRRGVIKHLFTGTPVDMRYKPDGTPRQNGDEFKMIVYEYYSKVLDELLNGEQK